ncbi:hypothetical protein TEA_001810 [Camellia sinensis var. sinensis]|uniref:Uncharacterized protein n=1 Tax=Camellia sinensis var. sinensis TaxID=542762 RepID=A0A4S4ETU5_CAMSN|nr:hypothetical protein TEA_001810 [Camellia sinensis var. sinensis]
MHHLEFIEKLVVGTGNGSLRALGGGIIEVSAWVPDQGPPQWSLLASKHSGSSVYNFAVMGRYYVLEGSEGTPFAGGYYYGKIKFPPDYPFKPPGISGRSESGESSFPSLIYAICACGSNKMQADGAVASPSWIAAGLSSGICRLIDVRSGNIISSWRAHDAYVTKLAATDEHLLISSSLDRTLRVWDLRRNLPSHTIVLRGHSDTVSSFSMWGQDVTSIAKNKIGLSSLASLQMKTFKYLNICQSNAIEAKLLNF